MSSSEPKCQNSSGPECTSPVVTTTTKDTLLNGDRAAGTMVEAQGVVGVVVGCTAGEHVELGNDCMSEMSSGDLSLPEVCVSTNTNSNAGFEDDMNYEVQQAYRIFTAFLLDKYKGITGPFVLPVGHLEAQHGIGGVGGRGHAQRRQSMCLQRMEEKFVGQQYDTITEFVADFRLMLENCYRHHGVDHWLSKQAQKLEIMLEQKLTLLSRTLREKTTLAVTSKGRFGVEEERNPGGTSTRRRSAPRSLTTITVGGHESLMVQTLRQEELQRAKDEKRQRELDKKEAEETSAKEVEEWERSLLSQASPHPVDTLWELPAIGHFLCLAQAALNLPEIVFFELERSLLMPRCSLFLAKVMSSLLCTPQKRAAVHRQPPLPYRRWERELRQRVLAWYRATGAAADQPRRAEQLGLCHRFFRVLGASSPLEEMPFHLLPFYRRVWLLKGLCDNVYETQKEVQDAVLAQPIHECRESILGYDGVENAYIHFPHFCGADLRIYFQSPCAPPAFPFPAIWARKVDTKPEVGCDVPGDAEDGEDWKETGCYSVSMESEEEEEEEKEEKHFKRENGGREETNETFTWSSLKEAESDSGSVDNIWASTDSKSNLKVHANTSSRTRLKHSAGDGVDKVYLKHNSERQSKRVKQEPGSSGDSGRTIKGMTHEPCLSVGEHCYTGRSPVCSMNLASPPRPTEVKTEGGPSPSSLGHQASSCSVCSINRGVKSGWHNCRCGAVAVTAPSSSSSSSESTCHPSGEKTNDATTDKTIGTRKRKRKKRREQVQPAGMRERRPLPCLGRPRLCQTRSAKTTMEPVVRRKDKSKKTKEGKKLETSSNEMKHEPLIGSPFKLVCSSIEELRELISKTEDQLDALQSTKKRSGRWYLKKEAVKDLHITLIRLLNELLPWEPKLVKAFQRNRLRMKKECDDFRKHPDYSHFVREECVVSSSSSSPSSSLDHEDRSSGRDTCYLSDHYRGTEEEDMEAVPKGLWTRGNSMQLVTESAGGDTVTYGTPSHPRPSLRNTDEDLNLCRGQATLNVDSSLTSPVNPESECRSELGSMSQSRDVNPALAAPAQASPRASATILHPTIGLPRGYTPIPTLFAKSVGNKVTLMKRPADYPWLGSTVAKNKGCVGSMPPSLVTTAKSPAPQKPPSSYPHRTAQPTQLDASEQRKVNKQLVASSTATASLAKPPQAKPTQMAVPKSPVKVVYRVTEGLDHVLRQDGAGQVTLTVQPLVDQKTGEKIMKQVMILPSKLLLQNNEEVSFKHHPQPPKGIQSPVSKTASPLCMSTNVPGFSIPEGRVPIQQVAPLKEARRLKAPSPSGSPCLQQNTVTTMNRKVAQVCSPQSATPIQSPMPASSNVLATAAGAKDPKQELKTVCIRDSQSILVTTRGGNTGIVKVQTLAEQSAHGSSPASPVITISPQFKAFLVSKGSHPVSSSSSSPTVSSMVPAPMGTSPAQTSPSVSKSPLTGPTPLLTTASSTNTSPAGVAVTVGPGISPASVPPLRGKLAIKTCINAQTSLVKSNVIVPSLCSSTPNTPTWETLMSKPAKKQPSTEERTQLTKFILVSPSPTCPSSNAALPKVTSPLPSPPPPPGSRFVFIGETAAAAVASPTAAYLGGVPKQVPATGIGQPPAATSLSGKVLKMGLALGQHVGNVKSESSSNCKNFTLPSGVQMNHPGQMKNFGQTIDTVLQSPCKSTPAIASSGLVLLKASSLVPGRPVPPVVSLTAGSSLQEPSSIAVPRRETSGCTFSTGYPAAKDLVPNVYVPSFHHQSSLGTQSAAHQPRHVTPSPIGTSPPPVMPASTQPTSTRVPHTSTSILHTTSNSINTNALPVTTPTPSSTSITAAAAAAGQVQQRIVINTSTHLAAGTQILLTNARFVVPPQGLGPGSHVLIISGQAPNTGNFTVPAAAAAAPPTGLRPVSATPRVAALPISPRPRIPSAVPALRSPVAVRTPPVGLPVLTTVPSGTQVRFVGAQSLSSSLASKATKLVSALPRLQGSQGLSSPVAGISPLVTPPIRLDSKPTLVFATKTRPSVLGSAPPAVMLSTGTTKAAAVASTFPPSITTHFPATAALPLSSLLTASTSTVRSSTHPIASVTSIVAQSPAGIPILVSTPATKDRQSVATHGLQAHPTALPRIPATFSPASTIPHVTLQTSPNAPQTGPNLSVKPHLMTAQPQQSSGTRTQVVPTVAVSPIVNAVPRMQSLGVINSFRVPPVANASPTGGTAAVTPPAKTKRGDPCAIHGPHDSPSTREAPPSNTNGGTYEHRV